MHADKDMQAMIDRHPEIKEWLKEHGPSLLKVLQMSSADPDVFDYFVLPISQLHKFVNGRFPMFKDDVDRAASNTLSDFLQGKPVDEKTLRRSIAIMAQSFNGACDRIARLESEQRRQRQLLQQQPRYPRYPTRGASRA